jgi:hypothetical protein
MSIFIRKWTRADLELGDQPAKGTFGLVPNPGVSMSDQDKSESSTTSKISNKKEKRQGPGVVNLLFRVGEWGDG